MKINWKELKEIRWNWLKKFVKEVEKESNYQKVDCYVNGDKAFIRINWEVEKTTDDKVGLYRSVNIWLNLKYQGKCWSNYVNHKWIELEKIYEKEMDKVIELQVE